MNCIIPEHTIKMLLISNEVLVALALPIVNMFSVMLLALKICIGYMNRYRKFFNHAKTIYQPF